MSVHVLIDPFVFAVPSDIDEETAHCYLSKLHEWCSFFRRSRDICSTRGHSVNEMYASNRFPTAGTLNRLQAFANAVSIGDVRNSLRVLSEQEPFIESIIGIVDIVLRDNSILAPELFLARLGGNLGSCFRNAVYASCLARQLDWPVEHLVIGTSKHADLTKMLSISGRPSLYINEEGDVKECANEVEADLDVIDTPSHICQYLDLTAIYRDPAVCVCSVLMNKGLLQSGTTSSATIIAGAEFIASLERHNVHRNRALLERLYFLAGMAAFDRLKDIEGAQLHPVRESLSANSAQRERGDGAKLWRCMLTKDGAGLRLHFWYRPEVILELHSITVESEL